jgi:undecaprenol kinase
MTQEPKHPHRTTWGKTFRFAFEGFAYAFRTQRSMKVHVTVAVLAVIAAALLRLEPVEWAIILILIGLVFAAELLNTAVEAVVDLASPDQHRLAKAAKDVAAAFVLVFAITAIVVGLILFISAFLRLAG